MPVAGVDLIDVCGARQLCFDPDDSSTTDAYGLTIEWQDGSVDYHQFGISDTDYASLVSAAGGSAAFAGVASGVITGWSGFAASVKEAVRQWYYQLG